jgi:hypothetical protein
VKYKIRSRCRPMTSHLRIITSILCILFTILKVMKKRLTTVMKNRKKMMKRKLLKVNAKDFVIFSLGCGDYEISSNIVYPLTS